MRCSLAGLGRSIPSAAPRAGYGIPVPYVRRSVLYAKLLPQAALVRPAVTPNELMKLRQFYGFGDGALEASRERGKRLTGQDAVLVA